MSGKVDDDSVARLNRGVVEKVAYEAFLNVSLRCLGVEESADVIARNLEIAGKPSFDAASVVDGSVQVPDVPGLVLVYSDDECEHLAGHKLQFYLVRTDAGLLKGELTENAGGRSRDRAELKLGRGSGMR